MQKQYNIWQKYGMMITRIGVGSCMKKMFKLSSTKKVLTIVVNKLKKNKKKIVIGLSVFLIVFISVFSFINLRYPTKINAYIAHVINKGEPVNKYFDDEVFYKAIVDAYNKENKTSLPYTTNLTDEQLKNIKSVSYSGSNKSDSEKIRSVKGIEKLINLERLDLGNQTSSDWDKGVSNLIKEIELSSNPKLKYINLNCNNINKIVLSNNIAVEELDLNYNNIRNISSIDLSKNMALKELDLSSNNISSIDLSKNTSLTYLYLDNNEIRSIDLGKNTSLTKLDLSNNKLSSIDLSKNTALTSLDLSGNNISNIDLSKNTSLTKLWLASNKISSIDLSDNIALTFFRLFSNNLSSIKLYDNFDISETSKAIGTQNAYQTSLDLGSNRIINLIKDYKYYCSSKIVIPSEVDIQTFINNLGLQNLAAKVFKNDEEISSGKVKEGYTLKLYYGDVEVDSIPIKIFENSVFNDEVFYKAIVDAYNKENKTSLSYTTNLTDEQLSSIKSVSYSGYNKSDSEKIKSTTGIEKLTSLTSLELNSNNIDNIDLSKNTSLTSLLLDSNKISSIDLSKNISLTVLALDVSKLSNIDLSKNTALTKLCLITNNIDNIDLSKNTNLTFLLLSSNKISNIDLSHNTSLTELELVANNISNIDLSKNIALEKLILEHSNLSNINLSHNTSLTELHLYNNNLSSIDLSKNTNLISLDLSDNNLSSIDLSHNTSLIELWLPNNNLSNINLNKNTALTNLDLHNNKISSIDLSKNTKLTLLELYDNPLKLNAYVKENETLTSSSIKMPEGSNKFYLTYEIEDNSIANFTDKKLNGLKVGKTNATVTLNGVKASSSSTENMKADGTITVFNRLKGDINNDDKITIADVSLLYRHVRGTKVIEDSKTLEVSDLTGDDKITIADVAKLYRYVRGKITEL